MEQNPLEHSNANGWTNINGLSQDFYGNNLEVYSSHAGRWKTEHKNYELARKKGLLEAEVSTKKVEKGSFLHLFAGG